MTTQTETPQPSPLPMIETRLSVFAHETRMKALGVTPANPDGAREAVLSAITAALDRAEARAGERKQEALDYLVRLKNSEARKSEAEFERDALRSERDALAAQLDVYRAEHRCPVGETCWTCHAAALAATPAKEDDRG
jgi:hypothetical protein